MANLHLCADLYLRSAQTVLYEIVHWFARLVAWVLVFMADEIWEDIPARSMKPHRRRPSLSGRVPALRREPG
jgi:isoleucyl-tRNA synthetase